jgi:hypothetical protein
VKARARAPIRAPKAEPVTRPAELKLGVEEAEVEEEVPEPESEPEAPLPDPEEPEPEEPEPEDPEEDPELEVEAAPEAEAEAETDAEELLALGVVEGRVPLGTAVKEWAAEDPAAPAPAPEPEPEPELELAPELEPEPEAPEPEDAPEVPVAEAAPEPAFSPTEAVGVPEAKAAELVADLQLRSNRGVVLESESEIPKLGLAPASARMYHQVLVLPKRGQATSSQYCLALATLATASPCFSPLTGQPVSVIQTSLLPAAAFRLLTPVWKRPSASSMELGFVFSK